MTQEMPKELWCCKKARGGYNGYEATQAPMPWDTRYVRADITPEDAEDALDKFCNTHERPDAMTVLTIQHALQAFAEE